MAEWNLTPTGQQEVDDELNSEVDDIDSKVAGAFIIILNIADEVAVLTEASTLPVSQRAWPTVSFTSITVLASHFLNGQSVPSIRRL